MISSENNQRVYFAGFGAVTPVGGSALSSAAAVRAGIAGFSQHPFMADTVGEPMRIARCATSAVDEPIAVRISRFIADAALQAMQPLQDRSSDELAAGMTLLVNLPTQRPGLPETLDQNVQQLLHEALRGRVARIGVARLGHAGALVAAQSALRGIADAPLSAYVVVGGDSYLEPDTLEWLEDTDQLHGAGERNNAWGFIPGEGAGAMLLLGEQGASELELQPTACIRSVGVGRESKLIRTDSVCIGEGLTAAFRAAFAPLPPAVRVADVYCDMNGEPYRADEYGFAVTRMRERFVAATNFIAPADCWGDVGAASAPLAIMLACVAGAKSYAKGPLSLVWASSETGERAAAAIEHFATG